MSAELAKASRWARRGIDKGWHSCCSIALIGPDGASVLHEGPMAPSRRFPLTCLTKPVIALAAAAAVDEGVLDLFEPIRAYVPDLPDGDRLTALHLLTHTALLDDERPPMPDDPEGSRERVLGLRVRTGVEPGEAASFSPYANWYILGEVLEAITGSSPHEHVVGRVLEPAGLDGLDLAPSADATRDVTALDLGPTATSESATFRGRVPGLAAWAGLTGIGTADVVARLFAAVSERLKERGTLPLNRETAAAVVTPWRVGLPDTRGDDLSWGLGFVVDSRLFGGRCAAETFWHTGWSASSIGFADPVSGIAGAILWDRALDGPTAMLRLVGTVTALLDDAGLGAAAKVRGTASGG